jgi:4-amino-4-deoxy-L-arabinose transferase-like glycosyltransferase
VTSWLSSVSWHQLMLLSTGAILLLSACLTQALKSATVRNNAFPIPILLLFLGGVAFYSFAALLDPFLNPWDERFHALVAKNLLQHPLVFMLYDEPVMQMNYDNWDHSVIWLHKPPFFLWMIALSFKIFGVTEFALRIPSVLMCSLLIPVTYRTGKILAGESTGFFAALFAGTSFFLLGLVSGRQPVDHNDVSFLFFVSASLWAWVEYSLSEKKLWLFLIGIFAGLAVLCKWLPGLLVYAIWGGFALLDKKRLAENLRHLVVSFLITLAVALPWHLYIFLRFSSEALMEWNYNTAHFLTILEGQGGNFWNHFLKTETIYGPWMYVIIPAGSILFVVISKNKKTSVALLAGTMMVYLFFSLAKTKMTSYPIIVAMLIFIFLGTIPSSLIWISEKITKNRWIPVFLFLLLAVFIIQYNIRPKQLDAVNFSGKGSGWYRKTMIYNKNEFLRMKRTLPSNVVICNLPGRHYVDCMFYTGFPSYGPIPSKEQIADLLKKGKRVVIIQQPGIKVPNCMKNQGDDVIIGPKIFKCD